MLPLLLLMAVVTVQSIRYFANDDDFNWNYGLALAATGKYREAEEALAAVQSDKYR
jgi:intraflagellar transport protein 56